ncbi:MAG: hypothetical protein HY816_20075 [Candidatus Wallbacteria bacterium]|nr:hypothetical protein [Candidatus Wallbacteria bacterium]
MSHQGRGALNTLNARRGGRYVRRRRFIDAGPSGRLLTDDQLVALTDLMKKRGEIPFTTDELAKMGVTRADLLANQQGGRLTHAVVNSKRTGRPIDIWAPAEFVREMREKVVVATFEEAAS